MILQRNIIYLLSIICLISFIGLFSTSDMLVNVCSGLFSGATIGVLTSIAQYRKIKTEYFASLFSLLKDYYKVFVVDEELLAKSITFLREHSFEEIRSCDGFKDFTEVNNDLLDRYNSCPLFSHSEYVSLNPFDKKSGQLLKQIDFEIWFAKNEVIKFHDELLNVSEVQDMSDLEDCIYSRTLLYTALSSGIQRTYAYAESIAHKFNLTKTKEYRYWEQYAEDAYAAVSENEEYLVYGDDVFDEAEEDCVKEDL